STMKVCIAAAALVAALPAAPSYAQNYAYVSAIGSGTACTASQPCSLVATAFKTALPVQVVCLNGTAPDEIGTTFNQPNVSIDVDCPQGHMSNVAFEALNTTARFRNVTFKSSVFSTHIFFEGSGTLILEDCIFQDATGIALDIEPKGPLNVVIKNSR